MLHDVPKIPVASAEYPVPQAVPITALFVAAVPLAHVVPISPPADASLPVLQPLLSPDP